MLNLLGVAILRKAIVYCVVRVAKCWIAILQEVGIILRIATLDKPLLAVGLVI
jgi:hypothetical protein